MDNKQIAINIAWKFLGTPYIWGGDDAMGGFDCSGFVIEVLKSVGVLPRRGDWTAQGLWDRLQPDFQVEKPDEGCLVFWENLAKVRIIHVELCLNNEVSIGASGGGSKTLTLEDAIKQNAFVKVRPFRSRSNIRGFVDPFEVGE